MTEEENPHPVCRRDFCGAEARSLGPRQTEHGEVFFVDRAVEDAAFIMERIDARWPLIINSFSAQDL